MSDAGHGIRIERARSIFLEAMACPPEAREQFIQNATDDPVLSDVVRGLISAVASDASSTGTEDRFDLPEMGIDEAGEALRMLWSLPEVVGSWRMVRPLAASRRSLVYMAEHVEDGTLCALKLLPPRDADRLDSSWQREVGTLGELSHPNVARLLDAQMVNVDGRLIPVVATELIDGVGIRQWAQMYAPSQSVVLSVMLDVLKAVAWLHKQGVVHGDLKPENILIATPEADPKPAIVDFGSAVRRGKQHRSRGGTLAYLSPERLTGDMATEASDQFSLGVMLYELLAGGHPYAGPEDGIAVIERRFWLGLEPLRAQLPSVKPQLDHVSQVAMAFSPRHRFASVGAFAEDLERAMRGGRIRHARPPWHLHARSALRRNRRVLWGTGAVVLIVFVGALIAGLFAMQAHEARRVIELTQRTDRLDLAAGAMATGQLHLAKDFLEQVPSELRGWTWDVLHSAAQSPVIHVPLAEGDVLGVDRHGTHVIDAQGQRRGITMPDGVLARVLAVHARKLQAGAYAPLAIRRLDPPVGTNDSWVYVDPQGWTYELSLSDAGAQWESAEAQTLADGNVLLDAIERHSVLPWEFGVKRRLINGETGEELGRLHWPRDSGPTARHASGAIITVGRAGELAEIDSDLTIRQRGNLPFGAQLEEMWISPDYQHLFVRSSEEVVLLDRYLLKPHVWLKPGDIPGEPMDVIKHVLVMRAKDGIDLHRIEPESLNELHVGESYCTSLDRFGDELLVTRFFGSESNRVDLSTGKVVQEIPANGVRAGCYLPNGNLALSPTWSEGVDVYDAHGRIVQSIDLAGVIKRVEQLLPVSEGRLLVQGEFRSVLIDLPSGEINVLDGPRILDMADTAHGEKLLLHGANATRGAWVEVFRTGEILVSDAAESEVLAVGPDRIATVSRDEVQVFDGAGALLGSMPGADVAVYDAAFMGSDRLVIARQDGLIDVLDLRDWLREGSIPAHEGYVFRLLAIDADTLLSAGADGAVRMWGQGESP